jgi:hypothetical protein
MFPQTYHIEVIAELITAGVQAGSRIQKLSADS